MNRDELEDLTPSTTEGWLVLIARDLRAVKEQATKTNGRVTKLERFMYLIIGALGVTTVQQVAALIIRGHV